MQARARGSSLGSGDVSSWVWCEISSCLYRGVRDVRFRPLSGAEIQCNAVFTDLTRPAYFFRYSIATPSICFSTHEMGRFSIVSSHDSRGQILAL